MEKIHIERCAVHKDVRMSLESATIHALYDTDLLAEELMYLAAEA